MKYLSHESMYHETTIFLLVDWARTRASFYSSSPLLGHSILWDHRPRQHIHNYSLGNAFQSQITSFYIFSLFYYILYRNSWYISVLDWYSCINTLQTSHTLTTTVPNVDRIYSTWDTTCQISNLHFTRIALIITFQLHFRSYFTRLWS